MKFAVLGAGNVGTALGYGLLDAGHEVVFGVRDPQTREGFTAPVAQIADAVKSAEAVINALPGAHTLGILGQVGPGTFGGKVLIDVANAITPSFELLYPNDSLGARLQAMLPDVKVVKTLNTIPAEIMTNPGTLPERSSVFLSGNDRGAKQTTGHLLSDLGWRHEDQVDLGAIDTARATEHYLYLSVAIGQATRSAQYNVSVIR
ncbi:NADPH-dependent F420 reductase [Catenuloplanes atrovinosus]|uniref:Dinucleotide-binding enzyme n=1 Tax=Catenuloplanes atrovinosus TaxID=137266 RepID=A0AAE3YRG7_9ACTN|nr:NAD(P)-binding domain-containing protein [Catenuloplanes atrovinosus]MDR7277330.1 putative dinucleotide-binding enzyme [Catenuloplanes atrovinosus]